MIKGYRKANNKIVAETYENMKDKTVVDVLYCGICEIGRASCRERV